MTRSLELFRRVYYCTARPLTADDLTAEQEYHRSKRRLQNRPVLGMEMRRGWRSATGPDARG